MLELAHAVPVLEDHDRGRSLEGLDAAEVETPVPGHPRDQLPRLVVGRSRVGHAQARSPHHEVVEAGRLVSPDLHGRERAPGLDRVRFDVHVFGALVGDACSAVFVLGDQEVAVAEGGRVPDCVREDHFEAVVAPDARGCLRGRAVLAGSDCHPVGDESIRERGHDEFAGVGARTPLELQPRLCEIRAHLRQGR